jgi:hypothetical protein
MAATPTQSSQATFLVGSERSGTTLLRLMLDAHPKLAFRYEFELAVEAMPDDEHWPALEEYYEFLSRVRFVDEPPAIDRALDYPALVRSFLEQKRLADRKPFVGAVVHKHFDRLLRIWPDAKFVHLVRDGRDVAHSCVAMGWYGNAWCAADRWLEAERLWDRVVARVPAERRIDVYYEDLVREPVAVLTQICELIGIDYHKAMLDYPKHSSYSAPTPKLASQWSKKLEPRMIQLVESRIAKLLVDRGYTTSGLPRIDPSLAERVALRIDNRLGVMRSRVRSLGPGLWLEHMLANRLGVPAWQKAALMRVHALENAQLD